MAMDTEIILCLFLASLFSFSSALSTEALLDAVDILSNSGHLSMALTLQLVSDSVVPHSPSLTIFSPSDSAFLRSGQPSLSLLQFHLSPLSFHLNSLKSLPQGSHIPTLFANHSLTLSSSSSSNGSIFLNGVKITDSLYDDGSFVILGIDEFLDPEFVGSGPIQGTAGGNLGCSFNSAAGFGSGGGGSSFTEAAKVMRSKGFSVMASFLDLQLLGFKDQPMLTILAPIDNVMNGYLGNVEEYPSIFLRHVVPCRIAWQDLLSFDDGMVFETYLQGFGISISKSGDILMLNEVPVSFPHLYQNDWLVVHGLQGILGLSDGQQEIGDGEF